MQPSRSFKVRSTASGKQSSFGSSGKHRASKSTAHKTKRSFKDQEALLEKARRMTVSKQVPLSESKLESPIVTIRVGHGSRLFACHETVLCQSPYFASLCRLQLTEPTSCPVVLKDEIPEVFSSILEYMYKGDYYPRLIHDKKQNSWLLEDAVTDTEHDSAATTVYDPQSDQLILKDTVIYCSAHKYGLEDLKKLAIKKQGLQSRIQCSIILSSARFAYNNTPENDAKLRAHYLALIIRSRQTFKRSGTLQAQMELGGKLFFDLFVAMCNHMDDISSITKSPR